MLMAVFVGLTVAVFTVALKMLGAGPAALVLAVPAAGLVALVSYFASGRIALAISKAQPAPREQYGRLHNLVEGLCIAAALPKPQIYVVEDEAPNAFATGRNPSNAAIAVTTGLLATMNRAELEGVIAHELAHIKNYDILIGTIAVTMVGAITIVSDLFLRFGSGPLASGRSSRDTDKDGGFWLTMIFGFVLLLFAPLLAQLMQFAISRNRETLADVSGAELTRYPPGMISALEKLRDCPTPSSVRSHATAHLWFESPLPKKAEGEKASRLDKLYNTHPPLDERIDLLRRL
jgi:heat shock protein HtpX